MLQRIFKYFFPPLRPDQRLPLLPREYSSERITKQVGTQYELNYIKAKAAARTNGDTHRLLGKHNGKPMHQVVKTVKRQRKREGRINRAWRKFINLGK